MKNAVLLKESNDSIRQPSFTCDLCGIKMKMKESLESHFNKLHILKFICKGCCKAYSCKASLLKHLKTHFEKYVCHYCGAEISTYENFQRHVYLKHEPDNTQLILSTQPRSNYHCRFCIRIFPTAVHRNSHERMIHKKRSSPAFVCQSCNLIFLTKEELRSHSFQHYSGMLYVCPIEACDKFFKTSRQLRNHTMIHNSPKFTCNNCNRKFHQSSNYSKHKKRCVKHSMLSKSKDDLDNISSKAKMQYAELCTNKLKHSKKEKTIPKKNIEIHSFKLKPHTNKKSASSKIEIIAPPKRVEEFVEMNVQKNFQHTVF
ncbi:CLUMA_CG006243, isoform A, partial [Clunio marinus]